MTIAVAAICTLLTNKDCYKRSYKHHNKSCQVINFFNYINCAIIF